jgi:hypothetical protein
MAGAIFHHVEWATGAGTACNCPNSRHFQPIQPLQIGDNPRFGQISVLTPSQVEAG